VHPSEQNQPLFDAIRELEWEACQEWRSRYRPSLTLEGAFAEAIKTVETSIVRRPGGNVLVTVSILGRKGFECEVHCFRLQRAGKRVYKVVHPDLGST
jgi:hypothetical protein